MVLQTRLDPAPGEAPANDIPAAVRKAAALSPRVPDKYGIVSQTPLEVEVTADRSTYDLELKR